MSIRRQTIERSWVVVSVVYGLFRASLVWAFLSKYGVNTLIFLVIELTSSALYGLSSARVVGALVDSQWQKLRRWIPAALATYAAPDAYVFASAGRLPGNMLEILLSIVAVTAVITAVGMWFQVRNKRREVQAL
jgi:hypothetical protein